jgi:hypothetical protein
VCTRGSNQAPARGPSTSPLDAMANALILVFAGVGLVGIALGIKAWRYASRSSAASPHPQWKWIRFGALLVGIALAIASFFFVTILAYPVSTPDGPGRIVGWPFFVAYFDSEGRDYVGFLTYVGALGNFVFWLLVPQFLLAAYARRMLTGHVV